MTGNGERLAEGEKLKNLKIKTYFPIAVLLAGFVFAPAGCGPKERFDPTPEGEFQAAYQQYEKEKYSTSIESFKNLIYKYPGSDLVEQCRYYLADAYYLNRDYLLAANEFELLNREFPQGRFADVALFKAGLAYAEMSRRPERDQTETIKAIETLQTLLAKYPNTQYADTARTQIDRQKDKMARKELGTAMFYLRLKQYDSAIIYLKGVLSNYPESTVLPAVLYHLYVASNKMGYPDDARDAKNWLCKDYPDSGYAEGLCGGSDEALSGSATKKENKTKN